MMRMREKEERLSMYVYIPRSWGSVGHLDLRYVSCPKRSCALEDLNNQVAKEGMERARLQWKVGDRCGLSLESAEDAERG